VFAANGKDKRCTKAMGGAHQIAQITNFVAAFDPYREISAHRLTCSLPRATHGKQELEYCQLAKQLNRSSLWPQVGNAD
jgi:hypothetical protein